MDGWFGDDISKAKVEVGVFFPFYIVLHLHVNYEIWDFKKKFFPCELLSSSPCEA